MKKRMLSALLALCILAGFLPPQALAAAETSPFTDVNSSDWYYEGVEYVHKTGLMDGTGENLFSPAEQMSRAMVATVLHRLAGSPAPSKQADFSDVPEGQWYSQAISWAAEQQIVSGYGNSLFGPHDPITRQQLTAILHQYAQKSGADLSKTGDLSAFADREQVSAYALSSMEWAVGSGLLTGTSATTLSPNGTATRGQVATILARFAQNQPKEGQFTVTFDLNYGENSLYQVQTVESGKLATKPADPARSGFTFAGWHTKKEGNSSYDFASPVTSDLVLYALWTQAVSGGIGGIGGFGGSTGTGSGSGSSGDSSSPYIYSITGITMAEGKPQVTINTDQACTLQVRLLDDQGTTTLDTATVQVSAQLELENIQVALHITPPEYFRLEASLLNAQGKDLCEKFLCINYTSAYAAFDAATVDDFQGQIVLNFDEQLDKNFGVLPVGTIQAQSAPQQNRATLPENTYVLSNSDHSLDQAKAGDIIAIYDDQGEVETIIKVGSITLETDQATIQADPEATLEDFYDLLKVDITIDADESMVDMSEADEGVTLLPSEEEPQGRIGGTLKDTLKFSIKTGIKDSHKQHPIALDLSAKLDTTIQVKLEWSPKLFEKDYFYLYISNAVDLTLSGEIKAVVSGSGGSGAKPDEDYEIILGSMKLPTNVPGLNGIMKLKAPITISLEGAIKASYTIHRKESISYSSEDGFHHGAEFHTDNSTTVSSTLTAEVGF